MAPPLENYLKTYRKRSGLSQAEVAYLLGSYSGANVSRHERFQQAPTLGAACAYAVLFDIPVPELFAGIHAKAEEATVSRAARLLEALKQPRVDPDLRRKVEHLGILLRDR